jgi:hypothetical protein
MAHVIHVIDEDPRCTKGELMEEHRGGRSGFQQTWLAPKRCMQGMWEMAVRVGWASFGGVRDSSEKWQPWQQLRDQELTIRGW